MTSSRRHSPIDLALLGFIGTILCAAGIAGGQTVESPGPATPETREEQLDEASARMREERERQALTEEVRNLRFRVPLKHGDNIRWYREATQKELDEVRAADAHFERGDYDRARRAYQAALDIRFEQWYIDHSPAGGAPAGLPRFAKKRFRLATEQTFWAIERLKEIESLSAEAEVKDALARAKAEDDPGKVYDLYGKVLERCEKMKQSAVAQACAEQAQKQRDAIIAAAVAELARVASAAEAGDVVAATDAFEEWQKRYSRLADHEAVRTIYERVSANPQMSAERKERQAAQRLASAEAALARKNYVSARRSYQSLVEEYPDTRSAQTARERLAMLTQDPLIAQALRLQEAEPVCKGLLEQARRAIARGDTSRAAEACDTIIAQFGDTPWAHEAQLLKRSLGR